MAFFVWFASKNSLEILVRMIKLTWFYYNQVTR